MDSEPDNWWYAGEAGTLHKLGKDELLEALADGSLSAERLLWREGWSNWVPAARVAELRIALPADRVLPAARPILDPNQLTPPPLQRKPKKSALNLDFGELLGESDEAPAEFGDPVTLAGQVQIRESFPTDPGFPREEIPTSPRRGPLPAEAFREHRDFIRHLMSVRPPPSSLRPPSAPPPVSQPAPAPTSPVELDPSETEFELETQSELVTPQHVADGRKSSRVPWLLAAVTLAALGAGGVWALRAPSDAPPVLANSALSKLELPSPPQPSGCALTSAPRRMGDRAYVVVDPAIHSAPNATKFALAYAASRFEAVGMRAEWNGPKLYPEFSQSEGQVISSVSVHAAEPRFVVDRSRRDVVVSRSITPDLVLGVGRGRLLRVEGNKLRKLWTGIAVDQATPPVAATLADGRRLVLVRHGEDHPTITGAWLNSDHSTDGKTFSVDEWDWLGPPSVTAGPRGPVVAYASRRNARAPSRITLARVAPGATTAQKLIFEPPAEAGGDVSAPVITRGARGFLLMWTQAASGSQTVWVGLLDEQLRTVGKPVRASGASQNAFQGTLASDGARAVSAFFVRVGDHFELWSSTLSCG